MSPGSVPGHRPKGPGLAPRGRQDDPFGQTPGRGGDPRPGRLFTTSPVVDAEVPHQDPATEPTASPMWIVTRLVCVAGFRP